MALTKYFEVRNSGRVLTIDDAYENFALKETISLADYSITFKDDYRGTPISTVLNTIITAAPEIIVNIKPFNSRNLLAVQCDVSDLNFASYIHNEILTIYIIRGNQDWHNRSDGNYVGKHVKILHYVPAKDILEHGKYGLQVFNAAGEIIFDSCKQYLKILDMLSQDYNDISNFNKSYNYNIAVIAFSTRYTGSYHPQGSDYYRHFFSFPTASSVITNVRIIGHTPPETHPLTGYLHNTNLFIIQAVLPVNDKYQITINQNNKLKKIVIYDWSEKVYHEESFNIAKDKLLSINTKEGDSITPGGKVTIEGHYATDTQNPTFIYPYGDLTITNNNDR